VEFGIYVKFTSFRIVKKEDLKYLWWDIIHYF